MQHKEFSFELIAQDDKARLGKINTHRGIIDTPVFMPVGTQGTIKGIFTDGDLRRVVNNDVDLSKTPIEAVMTKNFSFVEENDFVIDVSKIMEEKKIYSLIVKNTKNKITGLIRMHEILSAKII